MKVSVVGTGYVGLVSGTCFAEMGHAVTCIDIDKEKIKVLKEGKSPIYEPGLSDLLVRNIRAKRLDFSSGFESIANAKVVFLAVGTPSGKDGEANLDYLFKAAEAVLNEMSDGCIIVIKSTVPVGTAHKLNSFLQERSDKTFYLVNNPEFLKEGTAVEDFMRPDRVIIGHSNEKAADIMDDLYSPLLRQGNPLYRMSNLSAEMSKYAANCFLATKISFINEIARLCDYTGADIEEVRKGISSDRRIGKHFLYPGPGYGGSCFPKDVKALVHTAKEHGTELKIVQATESVNNNQKTRMFEKILHYFKSSDLRNKRFAFWGVAFKANTDDVRETAAIYMAKALIQAGAMIQFYDPEAGENFMQIMKDFPVCDHKIVQFGDMYECLNDCDGLVTITEWREFRGPNFNEVKKRLKKNVIFDARNLYETERVLEEGLDYRAIGKKIPQ